MFNSDFTQKLLEKIGGNSATVVLDSGGLCLFASSAVKNVLGLTPENLVGKGFVETVKLYTLENKVVGQIQHPVSKALDHKDFVQATPFFCKLAPEANADTLALITFVLTTGASSPERFVIVQIRTAKREVEVGEMKSLFVSFAAHQLKTPSSVVKGFLELMMRQGEAAYSDEQWHYLTSAFESNEQLIAVSKSLLNMARLEGGLIEPKIFEFDPSRSLQSKIASLAPLYKTKRVNINLNVSGDQALLLRSDEAFFLEIFGIILGNAIKHSPIGSEITVSCALTSAQCEVHVLDNGPGISAEVKAKLFKAEQDVPVEENSHGLGLYMAKKYIALLGGSIGLADSNAASEAGNTVGSDFYFIVPNLPA